jgi:hypothetical protein
MAVKILPVNAGIGPHDVCNQHWQEFTLEMIAGELWLVCQGDRTHRRPATEAEKKVFASKQIVT